MSYNLDTQAAAKADNIFSKIEQKGKYLGTITRAEQTISDKGTKGIDFSFKSNTGETADYLTLWTHKEDGTALPGYNALMAIMTCLRLRSISPSDGEIEKWDNDQQKRVKTSATLFKDLMNKPIGFILYMEEYPKKAGGTGWKPVIYSVFDEHGFTASEILSKAVKAETLDKMLTVLKDKPMRKSEHAAHAEEQRPANNPFDDDIPF